MKELYKEFDSMYREGRSNGILDTTLMEMNILLNQYAFFGQVTESEAAAIAWLFGLDMPYFD